MAARARARARAGPGAEHRGQDPERPPVDRKNRARQLSDGARPQPAGGRLAVDAPAKINLYLHVTGRRDDGYHLLESLVAFAGIADRLTATPADDLVLSIDGPFAPALAPDGDNLVLRAARALAGAAGIGRGAALHLEKNLPVASGIGGGSADAAAALRLLARLWPVDPDAVDFAALAAGLGADVPVCLAGVPALMTGVGDQVAPQPPLPACGVVLANAGEPVATADVFRARRGAFTRPGRWEAPPDARALFAALAGRANDLAGPAQRVSPAIANVLSALDAQPGCRLARLSGSGGTCFGLFDDSTGAGRAAEALRTRHPAWWVAATGFRETAPAIDAE